MKISASILPKMDDSDADAPVLTRQYICCIVNILENPKDNNADRRLDSKPFSGYPHKSFRSLGLASCMQICCGGMMVFAQIASLYWYLKVETTASTFRYDMFDDNGCGIWSGLAILLTGLIGALSLKRNQFGMIVAHLVMNCLTLIFAVTVIVYSSLNLSGLIGCKVRGFDVYPPEQSSWGETATTVAAPTYSVFGENLSSTMIDKFYCKNMMFTWWVACEAAMAVFCVMALGFTIWLIVQNARVLFSCCRSCCADVVKENDDKVPIISTMSDEQVHI